MANTFLTPSLIARAAIATLYNNAVMARLVWRDFDQDFSGAQGDTITIRKPATFTAQEFARPAGITIQDATEASTTVVLDKLVDVSFAVTAEDLALEVTEFGAQLLAPAMEAIVQQIDTYLLALRSDVVTNDVGTDGVTPTDPLLMIDARKLLQDAKVPISGRYAVLDTAASAEFLKDPLYHQAEQRGDTVGLREAEIGRKFGFDTFETQAISDGDGVAFHRTAFALAMRTLPLPMGAANSAIASYKGFGIRVVIDYDNDQKQDVVSLDVLLGVKTLSEDRACLILG